mgnify:CR=1 FL=1
MTDNERAMLKAFWEDRIPFNAFLGMKVTMMNEGEAEMMVSSRPELTGDASRPALHGGVVSALADAVAGLAVFTTVAKTHKASTVDIRVDYLRPGAVDEDIFARAKVIRAGSRVASTQVVIYQADIDAPIAVATAVYNLVSQSKTPNTPSAS